MWLWMAGLTGAEETGAKAGMRERSGGGRFVPLSFLVFLVCEDKLGSGGEGRKRKVEERQDEGGPVVWTRCPFSAGQDDQMRWREREGRELANEGVG